MTTDNKQKALLGGLAVLILGMGGAWFIFRNSGAKDDSGVRMNTGEQQQRRVVATDDDNKPKRTRRAAPTQPKEERTRRTREVRERTTGPTSRRRTGGKKTKKRKDVLPPAALIPVDEQWFQELQLEEFDAAEFNPPAFENLA